MPAEAKKQPGQSEYGPIHPTVKLIGTALAVVVVLYGLFALLSKSPEERAREQARDRQVLIDAEKRGAELLKKRRDPRGWGPGVNYDAGPRPNDDQNSNAGQPPTPGATVAKPAQLLPPKTEPDPRAIFQVGQTYGSDKLEKMIDKHFPKATFMPDHTVHVTSGGKSYVITTRKLPAGSAIYEIVSVRER